MPSFEHMAQLSQALKFAMRRGVKWESLSPENKEALELICTNLAHILSGTDDGTNWSEIAKLAKGSESPALEQDVGRVARIRTMRAAVESTEESDP
jgi:hypothetical protein